MNQIGRFLLLEGGRDTIVLSAILYCSITLVVTNGVTETHRVILCFIREHSAARIREVDLNGAEAEVRVMIGNIHTHTLTLAKI